MPSRVKEGEVQQERLIDPLVARGAELDDVDERSIGHGSKSLVAIREG